MASSFLSIDINQLDVEWLRQAELVGTWTKKLAIAKLELEETRNALELAKAKSTLDIRENPDHYHIEKVTEAAIAAAVLLEKVYQKAQEDVNAAKYKVDLYAGTVSALDHKKRALQSLVSLHGQDYFAAPRAAKEAEEVVLKAYSRRKAARGRKKE